MKKIVIVTGGSSGIGSCVAERLSKQGYQVYEFSRSGKSRGDIIHIDCDVTESEEYRDLHLRERSFPQRDSIM